MRHDLDYRIVLRTKQEYLFKYKFTIYLIMGGFMAYKVFTKRASKSNEKNLKSELDKFRNHNEEDELKVHERWYYTLLDKRLLFLAIDILNIPRLDFQNDKTKNKSNKENKV